MGPATLLQPFASLCQAPASSLSQGLAKLLIAAAEDVARLRETPQMTLHVCLSNDTAFKYGVLRLALMASDLLFLHDADPALAAGCIKAAGTARWHATHSSSCCRGPTPARCSSRACLCRC